MLPHLSLSLCCPGDGAKFAVFSGHCAQEGEREAEGIGQEKGFKGDALGGEIEYGGSCFLKRFSLRRACVFVCVCVNDLLCRAFFGLPHT